MQRFQQTKHVLGSTGVLTLVSSDEPAAQRTLASLWRTITRFEQRFSRFLPNSELTRFNQAAGVRTAISQPFRELLLASQAAAKQTAGLYNPFILPVLQRAGYKGSWPHPNAPAASVLYLDRAVVPPEALEIGSRWARIPRNAALDVGGIGKGYLLDLLAAQLQRAAHVRGFWLSLGGDIICHGYDVGDMPWQIGVAHAIQTNEVVETYQNEGGASLAVATSGTTKRRGVHHGQSWHHLIDPRTGQPAATDMLTSTVCAPRATDADVYASCLVILGSAPAAAFVQEKQLPAALLQFGSPNHVTIKRL